MPDQLTPDQGAVRLLPNRSYPDALGLLQQLGVQFLGSVMLSRSSQDLKDLIVDAAAILGDAKRFAVGLLKGDLVACCQQVNGVLPVISVGGVHGDVRPERIGCGQVQGQRLARETEIPVLAGMMPRDPFGVFPLRSLAVTGFASWDRASLAAKSWMRRPVLPPHFMPTARAVELRDLAELARGKHEPFEFKGSVLHNRLLGCELGLKHVRIGPTFWLVVCG